MVLKEGGPIWERLTMSQTLIEKIRGRNACICVVGLGYVGLPTAVVFAEKGYRVVGCDLRRDVVELVNMGKSHLRDLNIDDRIGRVVEEGRLSATLDVSRSVEESDIVLIVVPTPTGKGFEPDLRYVVSAGESVRKGLRRGHLVVLESTVYPGVTEELLMPVLEKSGLKMNDDFGLAYCPERYNPGDPEHMIDRVVRVVGGTNDEWTELAAELYGQVTRVHRVRNIRTAEMAKIIENTQRDLNIALMNEIAIICERMGIDVMDVINAASSKWNFNVYYPGAGVGGHCLPKDPWYLVKAAERLGYHAQVITAGRRVNDDMPHHMFRLLLRAMNQTNLPMNGSRIIVLGLSYKENVGDTRNSPALALIGDVRDMGGTAISVDPYVDEKTATTEFGVERHFLNVDDAMGDADAAVIMTAHDTFRTMDLRELNRKMRTPIIVDGRRIVDQEKAIQLGFIYKCVGAP